MSLLNKKSVSLLAALVTFVTFSSCQRTSGTASVRDAAAAFPGDIRMSLAHPFDVKKNDYEVVMSVPYAVAKMAVCEVKTGATCAPGSETWFETSLVYATADRKFFKANASALLEDGLQLQLVAIDATGATVDTRTIQFAGPPLKPAATVATAPAAGGAGAAATPPAAAASGAVATAAGAGAPAGSDNSAQAGNTGYTPSAGAGNNGYDPSAAGG